MTCRVFEQKKKIGKENVESLLNQEPEEKEAHITKIKTRKCHQAVQIFSRVRPEPPARLRARERAYVTEYEYPRCCSLRVGLSLFSAAYRLSRLYNTVNSILEVFFLL